MKPFVCFLLHCSCLGEMLRCCDAKCFVDYKLKLLLFTANKKKEVICGL